MTGGRKFLKKRNAVEKEITYSVAATNHLVGSL